MSVLCGCTQENENNSYYINQQYGFQIIPPTNWTVSENTLDTVKFFCPDQNDYQINLAIKPPITSNETVEVLGNQLIERYSESLFKNFTLFSKTQKTINGLNAYEIVFSEGQLPYMLEHKQVLFEKNDKVFSVIYTTLVYKYDTYIDVVDQSINTFTIL
jgi:hypothetical protein